MTFCTAHMKVEPHALPPNGVQRNSKIPSLHANAVNGLSTALMLV